jgi:hypothetical protein
MAMGIKNFFVLDPVGELLCFEEEINKPNRNIEERVSLISEYSDIYSDLNTVVESIPSQYLLHLLNGIEMAIRDDIFKKKKKYEIEIRKRQNKSLEQYTRDVNEF